MDVRYLPQRPFPPYAFVPGRQPHPVRDPAGHLYGRPIATPLPLNPLEPRQSDEFLFAIDLLNYGYYWEAHEVWESLWHAAGRGGPVGLLLKALIKLAAAGVKSRVGNAIGVQRHATRAAELFRLSVEASDEFSELFEAIQGHELIAACDNLARHPVTDATHTSGGLPVLGIRIHITG